MSKITPQDVEWVAQLSRLILTSQEKEQYAEQLSVIFDYVEMLNEVDTETVPETCQVTGLEDVVRIDEVVPCDEDTRKKIIAQFPERIGDVLQVKAVFEN